jgi:hypothetical protein
MTARCCDHHRKRRRRGVATLLAILLLVIVAATLPVLAGAFIADAKRTRVQAQDAQLRQLLTAGAVAAISSAKGHSAAREAATTRTAIALPQELLDDGAALTLWFSPGDSDDRLDATIRATLGTRAMEQIVRLERRSGAWQAVAAALDDDRLPHDAR